MLTKHEQEIQERADGAKAGPWKTYENPMRSDGLFVGQDMPNEPLSGMCESDGSPMYPAVPPGAWAIGFQIEAPTAEFIAAAREDVPYLLRAVGGLRELVKRAAELPADTRFGSAHLQLLRLRDEIRVELEGCDAGGSTPTERTLRET